MAVIQKSVHFTESNDSQICYIIEDNIQNNFCLYMLPPLGLRFRDIHENLQLNLVSVILHSGI